MLSKSENFVLLLLLARLCADIPINLMYAVPLPRLHRNTAMDSIDPPSGASSSGYRQPPEEGEDNQHGPEPQTRSGEKQEEAISDRQTGLPEQPPSRFMRQEAILPDSDEELEPEKVVTRAKTLSQAGELVHKVLGDIEPDTMKARSIQNGRFRCWEITRRNHQPFCLIHPQLDKGQVSDFWQLADARKIKSVIDLSGQEAVPVLEGMSVQEIPATNPGVPVPAGCSMHIRKKDDLFHYQLTGWADYKKADPDSFIAFARYLLASGCAEKLMVHCRAGLGRTGTFVQILLMTEAASGGELTRENALVWFLESIANSRQNRGFNQYVQSSEQFEMLLQCLVRVTGVDEQSLYAGLNQWAVEKGWSFRPDTME